MTKSKQVLGFIGWLLVTFMAAGIGSMASSKAGAFYQQLIRPEWASPAWLFDPVWTLLYLLMGMATWLVWRAQGFRAARISLSLYMIQLALNALWTWLFFVWRLGAPAFIEIIILWILILCTLIAFWRKRIITGVLLIPKCFFAGTKKHEFRLAGTGVPAKSAGISPYDCKPVGNLIG